MKIAFYKGHTKLFNRLVAWFDRSPYSHCELVLDAKTGLCGSSSFTDGGVRTKYIDLDSGHWDVIDVDVPDTALNAAASWFQEHHGEGYDLAGLIGFIWRRQTGGAQRWFCSEAVASAIGLYEPWRFDPATLYSVVVQLRSTEA